MQWKCLCKNLDELKPQQKNPRKISASQKKELKKSLKKFGLADPLIVNPDGTIIAGHQRYYALLEMQKSGKATNDLNSVICMVPDEALVGKDLDELTIRHNKNSGEDDFDLLANGYSAEDLIDWGYTMDELHLESIPEQSEEPKLCQLTAKFENEDDLRQAEVHIATILDQYASASYKVKVK